jgi:hypothetical protein
MARKTRDFAAEYASRKSRGLERGLTVSQARGHARAKIGEKLVREINRPSRREAERSTLNSVLRLFSRNNDLPSALKSSGVSQRRFNRLNKKYGFFNVTPSGQPFTRSEVKVHGATTLLLTGSGFVSGELTFAGTDAITVAVYQHALERAITTGDYSKLRKYRNVTVIDTSGTKHRLITGKKSIRAMVASMSDDEKSALFEFVYAEDAA